MNIIAKTVLFSSLLANAAFAQTPLLINYQGSLDLGGVPVGEPQRMVFSIYADTLATSSPLWSEIQDPVTVS